MVYKSVYTEVEVDVDLGDFETDDLLEELSKYIEYVDDQTETFATVEYQKNEFKSSFFVEKEDKDNQPIHHSTFTR